MGRRFRTILFWIHLVTGASAGLLIALLSFTGASLAFQDHLLDAADAEARRIAPSPPGTPRLPVDALLEKAQRANPSLRFSGVTIYGDASAAVKLSVGRTGGFWANPFTGELRPMGVPSLRAFFQQMHDWHRWLGTGEAHRATGKTVVGAATTAFLLLSLSGIYLWWPRKRNQAQIWFRPGLKGKARDFNWHHAVGFWSLPVLMVLTSSGMVISYKWATRAVYGIFGEEAPAPPKPPVELSATPPRLEDLFRVAAGPTLWKSQMVKLEKPLPPVLTFTLKEEDPSPLFASTQVVVATGTGQELRRDVYALGSPGRKLRFWLRFLHTGEALGLPGQLLAFAACLGALLLVWTGYALAWRRFFWRKRPPAQP